MQNERALVYVVDDDESVRESLESLIRSVGLRVMSFASSHFLTSPLEDVNSCMVLDLSLPGESGLDLQKRLAELKIPDTHCFHYRAR
jgi:FixJ family two-component response regulator